MVILAPSHSSCRDLTFYDETISSYVILAYMFETYGSRNTANNILLKLLCFGLIEQGED